MAYKKIFVGVLALSVITSAALFGSSAIVKAENENHGNNNENRGSEVNDSRKHEKEAKLVGSTLEVHITNNGNVLVRGAKVTAVSGNTVTATTMWGSANITWAVNTDGNTKLLRKYGGASVLSEIAVGDFVSFQGSLITGTATPMTVLAKTLKNWSIQKKNATFEGIVGTKTGTSFVLMTNNQGNITVNTSATTQIKKSDDSTGVFADIPNSSKVVATGLYNNLTKTLEASMVKVKQVAPASAVTKEGTIKTAPGTTAPTTLVMTSGGTDYTVRIVTGTSILTNNWLTASLTNFTVNNSIRVYGTVNADNTIDATVVRNTNL